LAQSLDSLYSSTSSNALYSRKLQAERPSSDD
jgi:hypothetical protein